MKKPLRAVTWGMSYRQDETGRWKAKVYEARRRKRDGRFVWRLLPLTEWGFSHPREEERSIQGLVSRRSPLLRRRLSHGGLKDAEADAKKIAVEQGYIYLEDCKQGREVDLSPLELLALHAS